MLQLTTPKVLLLTHECLDNDHTWYGFYLGHIHFPSLTWLVSDTMTFVAAAYENSKSYLDSTLPQPPRSHLLLLKWKVWSSFLAVFRKVICGSETLMPLKCYGILLPFWTKRGLLIDSWYSWCRDDLCIGILNFYFTYLKLTVTPVELLDKIFICLAYLSQNVLPLLTIFHRIQHPRYTSCSAFFYHIFFEYSIGVRPLNNLSGINTGFFFFPPEI